ncbi:289_t:CDS:2 [Funneliformis geosporum]|uniref:6891_t:CDS:1 n=1 Tax=Funneliformis geosporum TaxID=1117311 RepID=A0A9W4WY45_9GLOM|nr:6891_t:CDS:2 [Funneliformis geosporum]CAI2189897.1 289_t:CDS:2 [Funneliformis geosporum]
MTNLSGTKDANIYNEIARLNFAQGPKTCLFSYFTINEKSRSSAERALSFCENDEEKLAYLNNILILIKNSVLPEKFHLTETESINDDKMPRPSPEVKPEVKGKFNNPFEEFVQKLDLKQLERYRPLKDEDIKKFYEFAGPDFTWPSTSEISERRDIYDYITDPNPRFIEGQGKELAINRLAYRRLVESGSLDSSQGDYVHIEHGKLVGYERKISMEKCKDLMEKNPGMLYAPIKQQTVVIRFSSTANVALKEWQVVLLFMRINIGILLGILLGTSLPQYQVFIRIRRKNDPTNDIATMNNVDQDINNRNFRLILDSGRRMMKDYGWSGLPSSTAGYGENTGIYQVLFPWEVSLGDGVNWTEWIETKNLYCWQENVPNDIDCGLVGFVY